MKYRTLLHIGRLSLVIIIIIVILGVYLWFKPHREVQSTKAFAIISAIDLVNEFSLSPVAANAKYLASDGNSKVLIVEGRVHTISVNQDGEVVIILKEEKAKSGVSATFTKQGGSNIRGTKVGDIIKVKGAITAGNRYDADLDLYEHAVLIQCDVVSKANGSRNLKIYYPFTGI